MGIYGNVPAQIEADDDVQDNEGPKPRGAEVQKEAYVKEDKEQGEMNEDSREAIGGEALRTGKGLDKIFTITF